MHVCMRSAENTCKDSAFTVNPHNSHTQNSPPYKHVPLTQSRVSPVCTASKYESTILALRAGISAGDYVMKFLSRVFCATLLTMRSLPAKKGATGTEPSYVTALKTLNASSGLLTTAKLPLLIGNT